MFGEVAAVEICFGIFVESLVRSLFGIIVEVLVEVSVREVDVLTGTCFESAYSSKWGSQVGLTDDVPLKYTVTIREIYTTVEKAKVSLIDGH